VNFTYTFSERERLSLVAADGRKMLINTGQSMSSVKKVEGSIDFWYDRVQTEVDFVCGIEFAYPKILMRDIDL
jgi:hypothetical protein